MTINLAG